MIIRDTAGRLFEVTECDSKDLAHCYWGREVKKVKGAFVPKANARWGLVRKTATALVEA